MNKCLFVFVTLSFLFVYTTQKTYAALPTLESLQFREIDPATGVLAPLHFTDHNPAGLLRVHSAAAAAPAAAGAGDSHPESVAETKFVEGCSIIRAPFAPQGHMQSLARGASWGSGLTRFLGGYPAYKKLLFSDGPPDLADILQTTSHGCGLYAALASTLATRGGSRQIEQMFFDDGEGNVYIKFYFDSLMMRVMSRQSGQTLISSPPHTSGCVVIAIDKERDSTWAGISHTVYSSYSKLWLHLLERAYTFVQLGGETTAYFRGVPPQTVFPLLYDFGENRGLMRWVGDVGSNVSEVVHLLNTYQQPAVINPKVPTDILGESVLKQGSSGNHYYAVISTVLNPERHPQLPHKKPGVWIFNPLGLPLGAPGVSESVQAKTAYGAKIFFLPLDELKYLDKFISLTVPPPVTIHP